MCVRDAVLCNPVPASGKKDLLPQLLGRLLADGSAVNALQGLPSAEGSQIYTVPQGDLHPMLGDVGGQRLGSLAPTQDNS